MKLNILIFVMLLFYFTSSAQEKSVQWIYNIDSTNFKTSFNKKEIPKEFYKFIGIDDLKDISNPDEKYSSGCVRKEGLPGCQLHWAASDNNKHWVISIAYGGRARYTVYYYIESGKAGLTVYEINFQNSSLAFAQTIEKLKYGDYEPVEVDLTD